MASALDHKKPERLREVLLRRPKPAWPYPTSEEALALVDYLVRFNRNKKSKDLEGRLEVLQDRAGLLWSVVAPRQWEHFRSACQEMLRRLFEGAGIRDNMKHLGLVNVFAVGGYTEHPTRFSMGGTVEADEKSFLCFKTLTQRARDLQRRYADAGRLSGTHSGACFWFLQTPSHSEGALSAERLRLLSEGAQNALLEHVEYIANLNPMPAINELPSPDQLLVNAELAASYIKIKKAVSACRLPPAVNTQYEMVLDFPYITTLPLELLVEITNALEIAAEEGRQPTLAHLSGTAAVKIYTKRVDAVVRRLRTTFIRPQSTDKWQEEYLKPLKGGTEQPKHALAFRHREDPLSLSHPYSRISHRMARRIGTSKEAWEAERASRAF